MSSTEGADKNAIGQSWGLTGYRAVRVIWRQNNLRNWSGVGNTPCLTIISIVLCGKYYIQSKARINISPCALIIVVIEFHSFRRELSLWVMIICLIWHLHVYVSVCDFARAHKILLWYLRSFRSSRNHTLLSSLFTLRMRCFTDFFLGSLLNFSVWFTLHVRPIGKFVSLQYFVVST